MSRIGKKPIPLPSGVKIQVGEQLEVTGPEGQADGADPAGHHVRAGRRQAGSEARPATSMPRSHGLTRALAANAVQGVSARIHRANWTSSASATAPT